MMKVRIQIPIRTNNGEPGSGRSKTSGSTTLSKGFRKTGKKPGKVSAPSIKIEKEKYCNMTLHKAE
jgi:hypothetical protein